MTEKYFTVEQLALAYEEGWKARHLNKAVAQVPFEQCWQKSNTLKHANEIVDAARAARAEVAHTAFPPVPEVKPLFRKIELTIHGNMSPAVMLASGLVQVIEHFASNVTVEQAEAALALSRTALNLEAVDHNGARIHTGL